MIRSRFLSFFGVLSAFAISNISSANSTISVDCSGPTKPFSQMGRFSVGSDRALIFLRPEHQRDLLTLQKEIGFKYLRCHGLFNEEMKIVSRKDDGSLSFNWTNVDAFIDQLRRAKLKPFIEFGFMPETIASGKQTIFWWKGNVTPPAKMSEWGQLVGEFAKHAIAKYGIDEVRSWYFEVWNEPNLDGFWTGGQQKYFELYQSSAEALKKVDAKLRVGGPSTAGLGWIKEFVEFCEKNKVPLDFVSTHAYAAMQGFLDEKGQGGGTVLDTHPNALIGGFEWAKTMVPKGMPFFITEWGPSYSPRDPIHDSYICAPFILEKVRKSEGLVDGLSYWTFSDQFEEPGPPRTPFHGGFGLMTVDGLKKPAYFAYSFLAKMHKVELEVNIGNAIVTKYGESLRAVIWDYSPPKQDVPNDPFYHRDLKPINRETVKFQFKNLPKGTYKIVRHGVGYQRNDVYGAFLNLGSPKGSSANLSREVLNLLKKSYQSEERLPDIRVDNGYAEVTLPMRTNDVWYLELSRLAN